jgi:hypothetical protein
LQVKDKILNMLKLAASVFLALAKTATASPAQLARRFTDLLGEAPSPETWQVEPDPGDTDGQTLLFHYPAGLGKRREAPAPCVRPVVRLEMGARGDQWPAEDRTIISYAAETVPRPIREPRCRVLVLVAERTFWEKATVLHAPCHCPEGKPLRAGGILAHCNGQMRRSTSR